MGRDIPARRVTRTASEKNLHLHPCRSGYFGAPAEELASDPTNDLSPSPVHLLESRTSLTSRTGGLRTVFEARMVAYGTPFYQWVPGSGTASVTILSNRDSENDRAKLQCFFYSTHWPARGGNLRITRGASTLSASIASP